MTLTWGNKNHTWGKKNHMSKMTSKSILDISTCAYAKGVLFELYTSNVELQRMVGEPQVMYASRLHNQRYIQYLEILGDK